MGPADPHARLVGSALGVALRRRDVPGRARQLHGAVGAPQATAKPRPTRSKPLTQTCRRRSNGTTLMARLFHWVMAASMFVLLFTAFLPIVGVQVRLGAVALDRRARADRLDHLPHHPRDVLARLLVDLGRPEGHPRAQGGDAARARTRRAAGPSRASIRSATASITSRSWSSACRSSITGHVHDVAGAHAVLHPQPVSARRHDLGPHLRAARPGRRRPRRPRHRARLLRRPAREVVDHQVR